MSKSEELGDGNGRVHRQMRLDVEDIRNEEFSQDVIVIIL